MLLFWTPNDQDTPSVPVDRVQGVGEGRTNMKCLGQSSPYFTEEQKKVPCAGIMLHLDNFWGSHTSGRLDAVICTEHAKFAMLLNKNCYLRERLVERASKSALEKEAGQ